MDKVKCRYCKKTATAFRTPDIDIKWVPLCDDKECFYKLYIEINLINNILWIN